MASQRKNYREQAKIVPIADNVSNAPFLFQGTKEKN